MLVSALMGLDVMKAAYAHAIEAGYRFYSYGDASLLLPGSQLDSSGSAVGSAPQGVRQQPIALVRRRRALAWRSD